MSTNCFERLSALARRLDECTKELEDAWEFPGAFVGGYADVTEDTKARRECLIESIQSTQNRVDKLINDEGLLHLDATDDTDSFIKEVKDMYDTIKQDVDNLETVFEEYGYHHNKDDVNNSLDSKESERTSNSSCDVYSIEEVDFTPDLSWRYKKKSSDTSLSLNGNEHLSAGSAMLHKTLNDNSASEGTKNIHDLNSTDYTKEIIFTPGSGIKNFLTPLRDKPHVPIYSKHYYSVRNKNSHK